MNKNKMIKLTSLEILLMLFSLTTQKLSDFSEDQLEKSTSCAFKLVFDSMKIKTREKIKKSLPAKIVTVFPASSKEQFKKTVFRKEPIIPTQIIPPNTISLHSDPPILIPRRLTLSKANSPLIHPQPSFTANFDPAEKTFLHDLTKPVAPSKEESIDKNAPLVYEAFSPLTTLDDNNIPIWSRMPHITRKLSASISSCAQEKLNLSHLAEKNLSNSKNPIIEIIQKLHHDILYNVNTIDKEVAENIIEILQIYTTFEDDHSSDKERIAITEILKSDVKKLCSEEHKDLISNLPQRLICTIEAQKGVLNNFLSLYDLEVLSITQKLLEDWLLEGGDDFLLKSQQILRALKEKSILTTPVDAQT